MPPDPALAHIVFSQAQRPPLESGDYTIKVRQELSGPITAHYAAPERTFHVNGARFNLAAPTIATLFPPANACGDFANTLPHIVLSEPTLPWQRDPGLQRGDVDREQYDSATDPWLALLLVHEGDVAPQRLETAVPILTLSQQQLRSPPPGTFFPALDHEITDDDTAICQAVELDVDLFQAIAPARTDLACLTHVRTVTGAAMARKAVRAGRADRTRPDLGQQQDASNGCFAVVIGNRLPAEGERSRVHLVSLEGYGPYLPGPAATPFPPSTKTVRLTLLADWAFQASTDDAGRFVTLLEQLKHTVPNTLQLPLPDLVSPRIRPILADGYVPLQHRLRTGDQTVSWYRGPLLPYSANPSAVFSPKAVVAADSLLQYDPATGLFDASYAAAWQLGRMLALQSRDFSSALYAWREQRLRQTATVAARAAYHVALAPTAPDAASNAACHHDADPRDPLRRALSTNLRLAVGLPPRATPPRARESALPDPLPPPIARWLAALATLQGVPFDYLVPDLTMLPPESLRFFQLDTHWIDNLIDGALGIGRTSPARQRHDAAAGSAIGSAIRQSLAASRPGSPERLDHPNTSLPSLISGFLLRSAAVKGWPGLEVRAYGQIGEGAELQIIRLDRLGPDLLFCLVEGPCAIAELELREPSEGVHFGLDLDPKATPPTFTKTLRDPATGLLANTHLTFPLPTNGTVPMTALFNAIANALNQSPFTSAEFALQMTEGVAQVRFTSRPPEISR